MTASSEPGYVTATLLLGGLLVLLGHCAHAGSLNPMPPPKAPLQAYPPVVCVTPDWTPERCGSRQASAKELPPYPPVACLKPDGTPEPCESRQASNAHAGLPDGTRYEPGTHPDFANDVEMTCDLPCAIGALALVIVSHPYDLGPRDQAVIERHAGWTNILPPAQYDRAYQGKLIVLEGGDQEQMARRCPATSIGWRLACTSVRTDECAITLAREQDIIKAGWTRNIVMKHELGHCNGWPKDHRG